MWALGLALAAAGWETTAALAGNPGDPGGRSTDSAAPANGLHPDLEFIGTGFENASPLWYDRASNGVVRVHLVYDHERASPNRAAGHLHFRLHGKTGARLTIEFLNLDNVWNGRPGSVAREMGSVVVSEDGRHWQAVKTEALPGDRVQLTLTMPGPSLYVARVEPYRLSDLDAFLARIRPHPMVRIVPLGRTVQGRPLEIVQVGRKEAPHRVFLRARAHPWEAGGNWVVEGLVQRLLSGDPVAAQCLAQCRLDILPMANKDGVALGRTRFNVRGKDLNRQWDRPADPALAPENAALERWLEEQIGRGEKPDLALDLHNDGGGRLHISRPEVPTLEAYLARMRILEGLLRKHTWFTEGSTQASFRNPGSLGDGWLERFGIDAAVHEFNCQWIEGLRVRPTAGHWRDYGSRLAAVFAEYFVRIGDGGSAPEAP